MNYLVKFNDGPVVRSLEIGCDMVEPTKEYFARCIITHNCPLGIWEQDIVSIDLIRPTWPKDDKRIDTIGQNGNDGLHYEKMIVSQSVLSEDAKAKILGDYENISKGYTVDLASGKDITETDSEHQWIVYVTEYDLENGNLIDIYLSPRKDSKFVGIKNEPMDHAITIDDFIDLDANQFTWCALNLDATRGESPMKKAVEAINHPTHYNNHPSGIECIDVVEHMGFNLGNVVKYAWRCDEKHDAIEDLEKAAVYLDREINKRKAAINAIK